MRYLWATADAGFFLPEAGDEGLLGIWSDAGFAGVWTQFQSGMILSWVAAVVLWRSLRQTISTLSTSEAELTAAAAAWQVSEGLETFLEEWGVVVRGVRLLLESAAALTITENGANWRMRYFGVRGAELRRSACRAL